MREAPRTPPKATFFFNVPRLTIFWLVLLAFPHIASILPLASVPLPPPSLPLTHTPSPGSCLPSLSFPLPSLFLPPFPLHPLPPSRPAPTRKPLPGGHEHLPPSAGILLKAPPVVQHVSGHTLPDSPDPAPPALLRAPNSWAGPYYHPIRSHISGARFFQHLLLAVLPLDLRNGVLGTFPIGSAVKTLYMFKS